jgi:DUF438 domain-containing protein
MKKTLDLKKTVYELVAADPEVKDVMVALGFKDITKPLALDTVGKIMTIPKGAAIKGIDLTQVISTFEERGFEIVGTTDSAEASLGLTEVADAPTPAPAAQDAPADTPEARAELLKGYVARLSAGEDLEVVRAEFVRNFESVDAAEIARAEQELIQGGAKVSDVQRLCDVHSALFHGATMQEQLIARAGAAVREKLGESAGEAGAPAKDASQETAALACSRIDGHPVNVFMRENESIAALIAAARASLASEASAQQTTEKLQDLRCATVHYARKGDLIYPLLNRTYAFSGPSEVMWSVDDEIRDELRLLAEAGPALPDFSSRADKVLTRAEEMVYKENNILFPLCAQQFSEEDWMRIYYEMSAYETCLAGGCPVWDAAEERRAELKTVGGRPAQAAHENAQKDDGAGAGLITLGSGHMTASQIEAVLDTVPMELTFVDEDDVNRYFNDGEKLFKRPDMAIDRDVFSCHPPKVETMVRQILESFRTGEQDHVDVWANKAGEPVLVRYIAVRDGSGTYLGTLECVQNMRFAEEHFKA